MKPKWPDPAVPAAILLFLALIPHASAAAQGVRDGLTLALGTVIPALFPFLAASGLVLSTGAAAALGRLCAPLMQRLFSLPGAAAGPLLLGLTGGYPVGAQAAAALYQQGVLTRTQAERLLGFCNNTGPAFLIGVCGAGLRGSVRDGIALYLIHVCAALLTGLALTGAPADAPPAAAVRPPRAARPPLAVCLTESVASAGRACLKITAFVLLFSALRRILETTGALAPLSVLLLPLTRLLGAPDTAAPALLTGLLEMTGGLVLLPEAAGHAVLPAMSLLLGVGGLSIWCQTLAVTAGSGLSLRRCLGGKLLHGGIAAALTVLWQAAAPHRIPTLAAAGLPTLCPPAACAAWLLLSTLFTIRTGKRRPDGV